MNLKNFLKLYLRGVLNEILKISFENSPNKTVLWRVPLEHFNNLFKNLGQGRMAKYFFR